LLVVFDAVPTRSSSATTTFSRASATITKMCFITIELPFLNDMDGLEFLAEFDGRPPVTDQEFIDAYLSL